MRMLFCCWIWKKKNFVMLPPSYKFKQTFKSLCLSFEKFSVLVQKGVSNSK